MNIYVKQAPGCIGYLVRATSMPNSLMQKRIVIEQRLRKHTDYKLLVVQRVNADTLTFHIPEASGWTVEMANSICILIKFILSELEDELSTKHIRGRVKEQANRCQDGNMLSLALKLLGTDYIFTVGDNNSLWVDNLSHNLMLQHETLEKILNAAYETNKFQVVQSGTCLLFTLPKEITEESEVLLVHDIIQSLLLGWNE